MPDIGVSLVYFKALPSNAGNVYIGGYNGAANVTVANGSTDTTTGFLLAPGETSPPFLIGSLNQMQYICDNAGDDLVYIGFKS